jgi:hypothetical protein
MLGAGLGFAWSGVATKLASDDLSYGHIGVAIAWGVATAGASAIATLSEMSALQDRPAIQVAPVVFVIQTAVPVALAPILLGERFTGPAERAPLAPLWPYRRGRGARPFAAAARAMAEIGPARPAARRGQPLGAEPGDQAPTQTRAPDRRQPPPRRPRRVCP